MQVLPKALTDAIESFSSLPGVGPRTAERYAYHLLRADYSKSKLLSERLDQLHDGIRYCPVTFALIGKSEEVSPLYSDSSRDKKTVAVVEDPFDIVAIENTSQFKGTYHVLGGLISPIDGVGPEQLNIAPLLERVKKDKIRELIIATNASVEGESTALYISKQLPGKNVKVTRLARGLPIGLDLEYADQITLGRALEGRQAI
jgi:recombination protein RecR